MKNAFFCVLLVLASCAFTLGQTYKVLWTFSGVPNDGANPVSDLVFDKAGNIYGTTEWGGTGNDDQCITDGGCGTVFELSPNQDGTWSETVIYNFCAEYPGPEVCLDGEKPVAGLAMDSLGNLYGTTYFGGPHCPYNSAGCGTVFELSPPQLPGGAWTETVLHSFCSDYENNGCLDGVYPASHLQFDPAGNLYGTTSSGGSGQWWGGTVFELSPPPQPSAQWTETVLYNFCATGSYQHCPDGTQPLAGVTFDNNGNLYGTTKWGGLPWAGGGTVYELSPGSNGWVHTVLFVFTGIYTDGAWNPEAVVSLDADGNIFGTTYGGGTGFGTAFKLNRTTNTVRAFPFNSDDGATPASGVLVDQKTGAIYGTTTGYPYNYGNVYSIGEDGKLTVLYAFCSQANCADGGGPAATLSEYSDSLFGTTEYGGMDYQGYGGYGVVFEITP